MKPIRVLLADDHDLFRAGMRALLGGFGDIEVIAEAGDGREALKLLERHRPEASPDSQVLAAIDKLVEDLLGGDPPQRSSSSNIFSRLFSAFKN